MILADSLTIFGAILLGPVAFFAFNSFVILFICLEVAAGMSDVFLAVFLLLIFKILGCVWYFWIMDCTVAMSLVLFSCYFTEVRFFKWLSWFIAKLFCFFQGHFWYLFLILDLFIIAFLSSFAMKGPWFPLNFLTFRGECLSSTNLNTLVKV